KTSNRRAAQSAC
ncbi:hypothetical protein D046_1221B, partial [Vibrio parahaemolyticus V-223/04]